MFLGRGDEYILCLIVTAPRGSGDSVAKPEQESNRYFSGLLKAPGFIRGECVTWNTITLFNSIYSMGLCRIAKFASLIIASVLLIWILFPATIVPPTDPGEAIAIYVTDYGWHSRLVLPSGNGELIQYAYGDWNYFALNQQDWRNGLAALLLPTQGTLGRRKFSNIAEFQQIMQQHNVSILSLEVAQTNVTRLLQLLDERFNHNIATRIKNLQTGLSLVKDDQNYTMLHNSNHEIAAWLEDLGCRIHGFIMWANFRVKSQ